MKASRMLISTLKEAPNEAKIDSHVLLLRAGMIKNEVAGVYNYLPMGLRVLNKIQAIIKDEMDKAGSQEILCSALQPKELWVESGRWMKYGPELMRLKDRHDREFCLGPTHEEIFTSIARDLIKSPKQLPIILYQIQTKYRDEFRPRFGLIRSREFIMKDAYSFDKDEAGLEESYKLMYDTYSKIFTRFNLKFVPVLADTGNIGGNGSHQFMALSDIGESTIIYCEDNHYAADQEKASTMLDGYKGLKEAPIEKVATPNHATIEELVEFLGEDSKNMAKTMIYHDFMNEKFIVAMVRADKDINEIKLVNESGSNENYLRLATDEEIASLGIVKGFIGPVNLQAKLDIYVDEELEAMDGFYVGANEKDYHLKNVKFGRDFTGKVCDLRLAKEGLMCPICGKPLKSARGIEVGQVFKLQTKYSKAMNCTYVNEKGENVPMVMGCYGIGVTRTFQSIVEQYHDEFGIKWPLNVAPYHAVVLPVKYSLPEQMELSDKIHEMLESNGVEVVLDDRNQGLGFKAKDWELIGVPFQIIVGKRALEGIVELKDRQTLAKEEVTYQEAVERIIAAVKNI
ncbi:prolyl-tRNA synthetase [Anaeroplasma bactoclasticum]|jgi:prolyl-tRNA synthetase|uniref:Proline--tRNA ligase n=1 Tax=Anaeroplasma bactoclasticum TaxID=2088 RepID=A0A397QTX5_9MOLU|nr:proline--tRNA ligase [Anaeroplasma bactoclasticum]RIA64883.1 prolyl-tRNA synthetase [Anaeroplasma bactoclasticum]